MKNDDILIQMTRNENDIKGQENQIFLENKPNQYLVKNYSTCDWALLLKWQHFYRDFTKSYAMNTLPNRLSESKPI